MRAVSAPQRRNSTKPPKSLAGIVRRGDMEERAGTTLLLHNLPGIQSERVLLVGLGPEGEFGAKQYRDAIATSVRALNSTGATDAELHLTALEVEGRDAGWRVQQAVTLARESTYRFEAMKSRKDTAKPRLKSLTLALSGKSDARKAERGLAHGAALAEGWCSRRISATPPNVCTPTYLRPCAELASATDEMQVLTRDRRSSAGTLLSGRPGSARRPSSSCRARGDRRTRSRWS